MCSDNELMVTCSIYNNGVSIAQAESTSYQCFPDHTNIRFVSMQAMFSVRCHVHLTLPCAQVGGVVGVPHQVP